MFDWLYRTFSKEHQRYVVFEVRLLARWVRGWKYASADEVLSTNRPYYARLVYSTLDILREVDPHVAKQIEEFNVELLKKIREDIPEYFEQ